MEALTRLRSDPRVTVRRSGDPNFAGSCVVYWMQRSQRAFDNPALNVAVEAANILDKPAVIFFAPVPYYPHANLRHYRFLNQGIPDIAHDAGKRNIGFVLRRFPDHSLLKFCEEVNPALVVGDENPVREPRSWREKAAERLRVPLWTVDADVVVPTKLLEKEQYASHIIRPRIQARLAEFLKPLKNPKAQISWKRPHDVTSLADDAEIDRDWKLDRSVQPVTGFCGGTNEGRRRLEVDRKSVV